MGRSDDSNSDNSFDCFLARQISKSNNPAVTARKISAPKKSASAKPETEKIAIGKQPNWQQLKQNPAKPDQ